MGALTPFLPSERMLWASDFPHSDAKYPGVVAELREHAADMTAAARVDLLGASAVRLYGLPLAA
jgi:predicted TIM-barrel fold metal-dependent hydrolase